MDEIIEGYVLSQKSKFIYFVTSLYHEFASPYDKFDRTKFIAYAQTKLSQENDETTLTVLVSLFNEFPESIRLSLYACAIKSKVPLKILRERGLVPNHMSGCGSLVPAYEARISYLKKLKEEIPDEIEYLEYSDFVEECIETEETSKAFCDANERFTRSDWDE